MHWNIDPTIASHFALRFVAEFFKESQGIDEGWPFQLNMGHALSAPIVIVCTALVLGTRSFRIFPLRPVGALADTTAPTNRRLGARRSARTTAARARAHR